jgi:nickel superoxide dismutase
MKLCEGNNIERFGCYSFKLSKNQKRRITMKRLLILLTAVIWLLSMAVQSFAHCQVPCGIYDDQMRIDMIEEDIATIEKAMKNIEKLSKAENINYNQLVRWINTKEKHAEKIQTIVSEYFLTQKIKLADDTDSAKRAAYLEKLSLLHELLVYSMKAKQTIDLEYVQKLKEVLESFEKAYFGPNYIRHEHH